MNKEKPDNQENCRAEYKEISANHRFFISLRFITAAFTTTIQSALLTFYNQTIQKTLPQSYMTMIPVIGILSTVAVFLIEQKNIQLYRLMVKRGRELEFNMGLTGGQFGQFAELSPRKGLKKYVTHTWGIRFVYGIILIMWIMFLTLQITAS